MKLQTIFHNFAMNTALSSFFISLKDGFLVFSFFFFLVKKIISPVLNPGGLKGNTLLSLSFSLLFLEINVS